MTHDVPPSLSVDATPASSPPEDLQSVRLRRLDDLQRSALTDPDPWRANLTAGGGGLLRMGMRLEEAFETAWQAGTDPAVVQPIVGTYLKIMKQAQSCATLTQFGSARRTETPA